MSLKTVPVQLGIIIMRELKGHTNSEAQSVRVTANQTQDGSNLLYKMHKQVAAT